MAKASTLNAHYTSPMVIRAMYDAMDRWDLTSGNILSLQWVSVTSSVCCRKKCETADCMVWNWILSVDEFVKKLYPNADITVAGFGNHRTAETSLIVAIGNVPFGNYKVSDKSYDKLGFSIP